MTLSPGVIRSAGYLTPDRARRVPRGHSGLLPRLFIPYWRVISCPPVRDDFTSWSYQVSRVLNADAVDTLAPTLQYMNQPLCPVGTLALAPVPVTMGS